MNKHLHNRFREAHSRNLWLLDIPFSTIAPFLDTSPTANNIPEDSFLETDEDISEIELHQSTDPPLINTPQNTPTVNAMAEFTAALRQAFDSINNTSIKLPSFSGNKNENVYKFKKVIESSWKLTNAKEDEKCRQIVKSLNGDALESEAEQRLTPEQILAAI